ncbi:hypothetical protein JTE90_018491 [Oedothorax gibbosus]|uniref:Uncharacterized protein n=1 Tax=Oedothorax gibbosus TaxID=931172 RepID=A0AAV6UYW4_9ARAC|nr:hypothetical protein JTE90_018491 [Oedothorax gibbosus]
MLSQWTFPFRQYACDNSLPETWWPETVSNNSEKEMNKTAVDVPTGSNAAEAAGDAASEPASVQDAEDVYADADRRG